MSATPTSSSSTRSWCPATSPRRRSSSPRACSSRGSRLLIRDTGVNWTRTGFLRILERMGGHRARRPRGAPAPTGPWHRRAGLGPRRRPRPAGRDRRSRPTRCRWPSTSCRSWRCWAASPRARPSCAARGELRLKESDRIAGIVDGPQRPGRRPGGDRRRLRRARDRRPTGWDDRLARRPPPRHGRGRRRAGQRRGRRGRRDGGRRRQLPGVRPRTSRRSSRRPGPRSSRASVETPPSRPPATNVAPDADRRRHRAGVSANDTGVRLIETNQSTLLTRPRSSRGTRVCISVVQIDDAAPTGEAEREAGEHQLPCRGGEREGADRQQRRRPQHRYMNRTGRAGTSPAPDPQRAHRPAERRRRRGPGRSSPAPPVAARS